jgi:SSS family solute:Na+ symporter
MLIGTLLWAFYQLSGETLPASVNAADKVFPYFLTTKIPAGLAGLFMASLFSAAMSMLSSDFNCLSVVCVEDYYRKLKPESTDRQRLFVGKMIIAVCGTVAVVIAILIGRYSERILSFYYIVTSVIAAGLAGIFLLAFLSRRANQQGACIGIGACVLFTSWATLSSGKEPVLALGQLGFKLHPIMIGVLAHLVVLVVGYIGSLFFPPPEPTARSLTLWGWLEQRKASSVQSSPGPESAVGAASGMRAAAGALK